VFTARYGLNLILYIVQVNVRVVSVQSQHRALVTDTPTRLSGGVSRASARVPHGPATHRTFHVDP